MRLSHFFPLLLACLAPTQTLTFTSIPTPTTRERITSRTARWWFSPAQTFDRRYVNQTIDYPLDIIDEVEASSPTDGIISSPTSLSSSRGGPHDTHPVEPQPRSIVLPSEMPTAHKISRDAPPELEPSTTSSIPSSAPILIAHAISSEPTSAQQSPRQAPAEQETSLGQETPSDQEASPQQEKSSEQEPLSEQDATLRSELQASKARFWIGNIFCTLLCPTVPVSWANLTDAQ